MKSGVILLINVILICFFSEIFAQNSLWLMNGKKVTIGKYEIIENGDENIINYFNSKGKFKTLETIDVFSITGEDNVEHIFHKPDYFPDMEVTEMDIKNFLVGQRDGRLHYKDNLSFISSFPFGFVSIFYPPVDKIFFFPLYPSMHVSLLGLTTPEITEVEIEGKVLNEQFYLIGYREAAKKKRIRNGLIGAGAGILSGIAVAFIIGY